MANIIWQGERVNMFIQDFFRIQDPICYVAYYIWSFRKIDISHDIQKIIANIHVNNLFIYIYYFIILLFIYIYIINIALLMLKLEKKLCEFFPLVVIIF